MSLTPTYTDAMSTQLGYSGVWVQPDLAPKVYTLDCAGGFVRLSYRGGNQNPG